MKNTIINIISLYSPGKRLNNFINQLSYLEDRNLKVNCVLQNYPDELISAIKKVYRKINIMTCKAKNPAHARNKFLKYFYDSNYEYAIFLDDDVILGAKLLTKEQDTIKYLSDNIIKSEEDVALICLEMNDFVFRKLKNPGKEWRLDFWASFFIMKNLKKFYNYKMYFDEELNALEEIDFACELKRFDLKVIWHQGLCSFKQLFYHSTYGNKAERKEKFRIERIKVYEKNKDLLKMDKNKLRLLGLKQK